MVQMIEQPLQLSILKVVTINHKFLFALFAMSASYIIVLLQYEYSF